MTFSFAQIIINANQEKGGQKMNFAKLRGKIAENFLTLEKLSELTRIEIPTLSRKINGKTEFKRSEIKALIEALNLTEQETKEIFFS